MGLIFGWAEPVVALYLILVVVWLEHSHCGGFLGVC